LTPAILATPADNLSPAEGRKRKHDVDEYMAAIAARRVVRYLERAGFVVMKKPPIEEVQRFARIR
jgi:hypothetical protein